MADCLDLQPADAVKIAAEQTGIIVGQVAAALAISKPYTNLIKGETFKNESELQKNVVQERVVSGHSKVNPTFTAVSQTCGTVPTKTKSGQTVYNMTLEELRYAGPQVCINKGRFAFRGSYRMAGQALQEDVSEIVNNDVRHNAFLNLAGANLVVKNGEDFEDLLNGGNNTPLSGVFKPGLTPDAQPSMNLLETLAGHLHETFYAPFSGQGVDEHFYFIGGRKCIDDLRKESEVRADLRSFVQGQYKFGADSLKGYKFAGPYRGLAFGVDQQPLRASAIVNGVPTFVEPEIEDTATVGSKSVANPAWLTAPYEVGFLIAEGAVFRSVPESYKGEAPFIFPPQLYMGQLEFVAPRDLQCNLYGDFGLHIARIQRAYRIERPNWIIPVIYARCPKNLGLVACSSYNSL